MRSLPYNAEAERSVLGMMLNSRYAIDQALTSLSASDFYLLEHQVIFENIVKLVEHATSVDIKTITTSLMEENKLEDIGGVEYLVDISQAVVSSANIDYYIKIIIDNALGRKLISVAEQIVSKGYENNEDINDLVQSAEKDILEVSRNRKTTDFKTTSEVLINVHEHLEELRKHHGGLTGIPSGFKYVDLLFNGFQPGDLIILAARPSVGKTAFALNIAQQAANLSQKPVAFFSLEMGAESLVKRMISAVGRIDANKLRTGQFNEDDWLKYSKASSVLANDPIYLDETPAIKVSEIASKARKLEREHGLGLILIDYLQLISGPSSSRESRQLEVSEISRSLKGLARELNVPVIALSQLSRNVEQRADKRPMMSDLRESGAIEQDADIVAFIHRDDYYNKDIAEIDEDNTIREENDNVVITELIVAKHRNGPTDTIKLSFEKKFNRFTSLEMDPE